jgi:serine protease AprX
VKKRRAVLRRRLDIVRAEHMTVTIDQLNDLADDSDVKYVTMNRRVKMNLDEVTAAVSADLAWSYGYDGTGIGIAVIDSGIASHDDVKAFGTSTSRVVYSESFVPGDTSTGDKYGHGTHVAGVAAGNGFDSQPGRGYQHQYQGVAPGANIINLRVLDANGCGTDSAVIAAIQRAVQLKSQYNIRVMNLSLGRRVYESFTDDPLNQAVEQAWQAGIVVVVAAGNSGRDNSYGTDGYGTIGVPGNDPYVITVGAMDTRGTFTAADDKIATYSSKGPTLIDHVVKPDLVAPGDKVVSLLAPNATLVVNNGNAKVAPTSGTAQYLKLSGTSMATPVVSGAVALLLDKDPTLTPDVVKARLMKSAWKNLPMLTNGADKLGRIFRSQYDVFTYGAGYLNIPGALNSTDKSTGVALSPRVLYNSLTRRVTLDSSAWTNGLVSLLGKSVLWGNSVIWGNSVLWGNSVIWGDSSLLSNSVLWGDSVIWGDSSTKGFSVIWGDSVIWGGGAGMEAFSETEGGDCEVNADGTVACEQ